MVLGGGPHHGWSANVDLFHAGVEVCPGGHGLGEGVKVHNHQFEWRHPQIGQLCAMIRLAGVGEDPGMHVRMQSFHSPLQALGESRELVHRGHRNAQLSNAGGGGAGRNDLHVSVEKRPGQILQPGLIVNTN